MGKDNEPLRTLHCKQCKERDPPEPPNAKRTGQRVLVGERRRGLRTRTSINRCTLGHGGGESPEEAEGHE